MLQPVKPSTSTSGRLENIPKEPVVPLQSSLASLFDNKDPSGFGMGGMMGIRAGIPKMPSFKVNTLVSTIVCVLYDTICFIISLSNDGFLNLRYSVLLPLY